MKNQNNGFIVPVLLGIIALLVIGGGVYVYENKKAAVPVAPANTDVQTTNQTVQTDTQTSSNQSAYVIRESSEVVDALYKDYVRMNSLSQNPVKPGAVVTINGVNFSSQKNFIKLLKNDGASRALLEVYVPSADGKTLTFTVPRNAPAGTYMLSVVGEVGYDVFRDFRIVSN